ncbi:MAG: tRNA dihydrouridine synthase DusB [Legionellales bacterium]|nr:tRNA dihydrouridine synthase DusB [Legionellales bacterium]
MKPISVGKHTINPPIILAPMAGVTDRPFRQLCRQLGAGLAVSEMVGANSLLHGSEKTKRRANHDGELGPCSVQIVGADPKMLAQAAKINADEGADIIDINMGCPAKKICKTAAGSALLQDEPLVRAILEAVVSAVDIPVTLKIRTGWDTANRNAIRIGKMAESIGVQMLSIHGRTRACMFKGEAEYDTIAQVKAELSIPVIANGDITTPEKAKLVLEKTGADGIMVGRAAQGRPWIFDEMTAFLSHGKTLTPPSVEQVRQWMMGHVERLYEFYGEDRGVLIARKHVSWYSKGQHGGAAFRHTFNQLTSAQAQLEAAQAFFDTLTENVA